jgi:hypothetical protein
MDNKKIKRKSMTFRVDDFMTMWVGDEGEYK